MSSKKCSECVCYGACVILAKFINIFSEEKSELLPCRHFRPYDPREQITAKWETDGKFPRCSHCKEHCSRQEKYCPNCGAKMEGEKEASPKPMSDYIERGKVYEMLNALGGCGAEPESWADGWDNAIDTAIDGLNAIPAADVAPAKHGKWQATKKHMWYKDKYRNPDISAFSVGSHRNGKFEEHEGVECRRCGKQICVLCHPDWKNQDDTCAYKHYICSCCGYEVMRETVYCPDCGAMMNGKEVDGNG